MAIKVNDRKSIAAVYAGKSAAQRAKLRKFSPEQVAQGMFTHSRRGDPSAWGFSLSLQDRHPLGGVLRVGQGTRHALIEYEYLGVRGSHLIPYLGTAHINPIQQLVGFDADHGLEVNTLWHFEIEERAPYDRRFKDLLGLLKESIADVHLLRDGTYCRPYRLGEDLMVEYRGQDSMFVSVTSLKNFLAVKCAEVQRAA